MLEETLGGTGNISSHHAEFVVTPVTSTGGAREFRQSMVPHPLVHQELPHEPHFGIYNGRLRSLSYAKGSADDIYWRLRRSVMLSHTGELPTEIRGPDAEAMLDRVFYPQRWQGSCWSLQLPDRVLSRWWRRYGRSLDPTGS